MVLLSGRHATHWTRTPSSLPRRLPSRSYQHTGTCAQHNIIIIVIISSSGSITITSAGCSSLPVTCPAVVQEIPGSSQTTDSFFHKTTAIYRLGHGLCTSVSTGPGPGPLQSNIASVQSRNIFRTGLGPCVAFALLFLLISSKPHFASATKKIK